MGRIVTPDGLIPGEDGKPDRPPPMQDRIELALNHWKFNRRAEAFATALNCIAYLSNGLAGLAKSNEALRIQTVAYQEAHKEIVKVLAEQQEEINKLKALPPAPPQSP